MWPLAKHTDTQSTDRPGEMGRWSERGWLQGENQWVPCISKLLGSKSWLCRLLAECPEHISCFVYLF